MKKLSLVLLALAVLCIAAPALAEEATEPSFEEILFGAEAGLLPQGEPSDAAVVDAEPTVEATDAVDVQWLTGSEDAPVSFYLTTRCGSWRYAGCCSGNKTKWSRSCYIVELPWETWTETKCQNACML